MSLLRSLLGACCAVVLACAGAAAFVGTGVGITKIAVSSAFTPASLKGLVFAISPDRGVTLSGSNVTAVSPAYGAAISLTCPGGNQPTLASAIGPNNQSLFRFTASGSQFCNFSSSFSSTTYTAAFLVGMQDITSIRTIFGKQSGSGGFIATGASAQVVANNLRMKVGAGSVVQQQMTFASFTGSISTTTLTASGVTGFLQLGQTLAGTGITANTKITAQLTGTSGSDGTYTVSNSQTVSSEAMAVNAALSKNMNLVIIKYDGVNSAAVSINGVAVGSITGLGAGTATFDQIGATASLTFGDFYLGPALLYNRQTTAAEDAQLLSYFSPWIGSTIWLAAAGSDSSVTPWNQTTPFQTLPTAMAFDIYGTATVAPKGGEIIRLASTQQTLVAGASNARRAVLDGGLWGTGMSEIRSSLAPTCSVSAGFVYDCGVVTAPNYQVLHLPGGVISFGTNFTLGSMHQLVTQTITNCGDVTAGHWGITAGATPNHLCVNAGVAIGAGEIEYATAAGTHLASPLPNWTYRNLILSITSNGCTGAASNNTTFYNLRGYFCDDDGFDASPNAAITNFLVQNTIAAYIGLGYVGLGGAAGDCFAIHGSTVATLTNNQGWYCGKTGMSIQNTATVTASGNLMVAGLPYYTQQNTTPDGSYLLTNNIGVIPTGSVLNNGIQNNATSMTMTAYFNTIYSQSAGTAGVGLSQTGSGGSLVAKNNIFMGFLTGETFTGAGTLTASNNDLFGNGTNYGSGTSAAPGDIAANPQFTSPSGFDFTVPQNSPVIGAGVAIPGVTVDYAGKSRPVLPGIGALNYLLGRDLDPAANDDVPAFLDRAA